MFGIGDSKTLKDKVNSVDLTQSNDLQTYNPKYEYTVKVFEEGDDGRPLTSIQRGVKANSDNDLRALYALSEQKIQILEKRELNQTNDNNVQPQSLTSSDLSIEQKVRMAMQNQNMGMAQMPQLIQQPQQAPQKPVEPQIRYFSGGGIDFKIVGDDVYQKQWIRATEEDCKKIRIINDSNNKIVELKGKHIEILNWVKVDSSTDKDVN